MSKTRPLVPTTIRVFDDRQPDPATVVALKASMAEIGLLNPILVQRYTGCGAQIVAGRNRLQAAIELGWETIDAIELPELNAGADAEAIGKLAEIAENLHRREITALERSELQTAWVEIVGARKRDTQSAEGRPIEKKQRADGKGHRKPSGINQAARELGVPRSTLQQSVKIAKLAPEAKAEARTLGLDNNQEALLAAAKAKTPEAQAEVIRERAAQARPDKPREPSALPGAKPGSAKWISSKRKCPESNCVAGLPQEPVLHLFEGDRLAARIISARNGVLLFVADGNGLHQVGGIYPNRKRALAALGGLL